MKTVFKVFVYSCDLTEYSLCNMSDHYIMFIDYDTYEEAQEGIENYLTDSECEWMKWCQDPFYFEIKKLITSI